MQVEQCGVGADGHGIRLPGVGGSHVVDAFIGRSFCD
jgi:hypothetical protein